MAECLETEEVNSHQSRRDRTAMTKATLVSQETSQPWSHRELTY
jgi:hypothetical protein